MTYQPHQSEDLALKPVAGSMQSEVKMPECRYSKTGNITDFNTYTADQMQEYADARVKEALERAAKICDEQAKEPECPERAKYCADAIRTLMKEKKQ